MHFPKLQTILHISAMLFLFTASAAIAADPPGNILQESSKKRIERGKTFLLRSSDDLSRTLSFVNESIALLNEQIDAAASREPDSNPDERLALLEWYQKYADWLTGMSAELDLDVSNYFSGQKAGAGWPALYDELAKGCRKRAGELGATVQKLEGDKKKIEARMQKLNTAVVERRILVDKDDLELARELWPTYRFPYDRREATYKELSDEEVLYFRNQLRPLGEQQKYFECLAELGKYEQGWLDIKAEEFAKLSEIAEVIRGNDPNPVIYAFRGAIRTYEADIAALKRRSGELDAKIHGITRTGSLKALDRLEELSRYYEKMKNRYERHIEWLRGQIGSYQADLIEISKEL